MLIADGSEVSKLIKIFLKLIFTIEIIKDLFINARYENTKKIDIL